MKNPTLAPQGLTMTHPKHGLALQDALIPLLMMVPILLLDTPLRLLLYVPALLYRFSLKATIVVYMHFIWMADQLTTSLPVYRRLEIIRHGSWPALRRAFSWIVVIVFVGKIGAYSAAINVSEWLNRSAFGRFIEIYVTPATVHVWQLAALINSIMALAIMLHVADKLLERKTDNRPVDDETIENILRWVAVASSVLGFYSTIATVYIILHHTPFIRWPKLGKWWP
jgi:hypothetical protein